MGVKMPISPGMKGGEIDYSDGWKEVRFNTGTWANDQIPSTESWSLETTKTSLLAIYAE
jgi:hypothetical protein